MDDHTLPSENDTAPTFFDDSDAPTGFDYCTHMPKGMKALTKNIKIWREPASSAWLMEPMPSDVDEMEWTHAVFDTEEASSRVFHRGPIDFIFGQEPLLEPMKIVRHPASGQAPVDTDLHPPRVGETGIFRSLSNGTFVHSTGASDT